VSHGAGLDQFPQLRRQAAHSLVASVTRLIVPIVHAGKRWLTRHLAAQPLTKGPILAVTLRRLRSSHTRSAQKTQPGPPPTTERAHVTAPADVSASDLVAVVESA